MVEQVFSFPDLTPLTRLHVQDSLRINADRWLLAHNYHRQRQNLHYQALWEPGIVYGLGVKVIGAPADVPSQFRDQRWIEIQPGIAIDIEGNPIVVSPEEDRTYRIAAPAPLEGTRMLQVVVRYVDPDNLELDVQSDRVIERFRFDQRIGRQLRAKDIELCRIELAPGETILRNPTNPFEPLPNELDLCYRHRAQLRSQSYLQIGSLTALGYQKIGQWQTLLNSLSTQCSLCGYFNEDAINPVTDESLAAHDLIYVTGQRLLQWQADGRTREWEALRQYLLTDGVLYVEADRLEMQLHQLLEQLVETELQPLMGKHPIKHHPFRFGQLPNTEEGPIDLLYGGGIILTRSALAAAWDSDYLPRYVIRSAQEFGVNILDFAWRRRYLRNLLS